MSRRYDEELSWLQQELLNAEEEEYEEFDDYEDCGGEEYGEFEDDLDFEAGDEEFEDGDIDDAIHIVGRRYGRGSPKRFEDKSFFQDDVDDSELIYKKDYIKAKRKKAGRNLGLVILAFAELAAIAAVLLWWASWVR